jgi:hypothetical protein
MNAIMTDIINALNAQFAAAQDAAPDESTHTLTYDVAIAAGLTMVRADDESGWLFRDANGNEIYGWESGGFSEAQ